MQATMVKLLNKNIVLFDCQDDNLGIYYVKPGYSLQISNPYTGMIEEVCNIYCQTLSGYKDKNWILVFNNPEQQTNIRIEEEIEIVLYKAVIEI